MLQLRCPHWIRRPTQQPPRVSLDSLLSALDNPTDPFCLGQIAAVRQAVSRHMADRTGVEGVNQLHTALCFRPAVKSFRHMRLTLERNRGRPLMCRLVFGSFGPNGEPSNRLGKRVCGVGFQPGVPDYDRQHREHQRRCKQARRLEAVTEAQTCAYKHDARGLYQVIKRIAPKQTYRRLQLRDDQGTMLTPIEEADPCNRTLVHVSRPSHRVLATTSPRRPRLSWDLGLSKARLSSMRLLYVLHCRLFFAGRRFQRTTLREQHGASAPTWSRPGYAVNSLIVGLPCPWQSPAAGLTWTWP